MCLGECLSYLRRCAGGGGVGWQRIGVLIKDPGIGIQGIAGTGPGLGSCGGAL